MKKIKSAYSFKIINSLIILFIIFSSCDEEVISGCMDTTACNFSTEATEGDDSCLYAQQNLDCDGNCTADIDCAGNCGGNYLIDDCNDCIDAENINAAQDCAGVCDGNTIIDCSGECGGSAILDDCGVCDGNGPNESGCCEDDIIGCTGLCGDDSYLDCNSDCCEPLVYNECLDILVNDSQTIFCEEHFANDSTLLTECQSLVVTTLDAFCELHFGCATIDCSGECTGGNTGLLNYDFCGCFESYAINYWCNDGGQCPNPGGTSVPSADLLDCQDECIVATLGSYIVVNPYTYNNGVAVYNELDSCCYGCPDDIAANYEEPTLSCSGINIFYTCQYTNYLKIGEVTDTTIEILINSSEDIYGFQFSVDGLTITGASGGLAENNGFATSTGSNSVLGLDFSGGYIPETTQEEILTILDYENLNESLLCLPESDSDLIISGESGADITSEFIIHHESLCP